MASFITAKDNPKYRLWKSLSARKYREREGLFLMEGPVLIREALGAGQGSAEALLVRSGSEDSDAASGLIRMAEALETRVFILPGQLFDELSDTETGRDLIGVFRIPDRFPGRIANGLVVLDRIQDPGNMGTIFRTAEAAGFDGIIAIKGTVDAFSPKVVRAAAGAVLRVPIRYVESEEEAVGICREQELLLIAGDPQGESIYEAGDLSGRTALIIGNEGAGVSKSLLSRADVRAAIPMAGETESLNAAVAAAIMMYEIVRQRGQMICRKN